MAIYIDRDTRLVVQGATGSIGRELIPELMAFGTDVVAGVSPGSSGVRVADVPVYGTVERAVEEQEANASLVVVPAPYVLDACLEAIEAGLKTVVIVSEGVPSHDLLTAREYGRRWGTDIIGPNTLGVVSPGKASAMLLYHTESGWISEGSTGILARSGSTSLEVASWFTSTGIGQSTVLSVGGDVFVGTSPADVIEAFDADPETERIVYVGEIGSNYEEEAAEIIPDIQTPIYASIIGRNAPPGKKMGHAGAIAAKDTDKIALLREAGATVVDRPSDLISVVQSDL